MLSQPNDDAVSIRPFLYDHRPHSSGHPGADRHTHIFHMSSIMIIIMNVVIILNFFIVIFVIIITRPYATLVRPSLISASFYAHYVEHLLRGKEARIES